MRIHDHNADARRVFGVYAEHAQTMWEARERKRARRQAGRTPVGASSGGARVKSRRSS